MRPVASLLPHRWKQASLRSYGFPARWLAEVGCPTSSSRHPGFVPYQTGGGWRECWFPHRQITFPHLLCQALMCGCDRASPAAGSETYQLTVAEPESEAIPGLISAASPLPPRETGWG